MKMMFSLKHDTNFLGVHKNFHVSKIDLVLTHMGKKNVICICAYLWAYIGIKIFFAFKKVILLVRLTIGKIDQEATSTS